MKNTKKRRAMELLYLVGQRRGRRNSGESDSPTNLGRAARTAVITAEGAALVSMSRWIRSRRGRRILPILAAAYLARHIGTRSHQNG